MQNHRACGKLSIRLPNVGGLLEASERAQSYTAMMEVMKMSFGISWSESEKRSKSFLNLISSLPASLMAGFGSRQSGGRSRVGHSLRSRASDELNRAYTNMCRADVACGEFGFLFAVTQPNRWQNVCILWVFEELGLDCFGVAFRLKVFNFPITYKCWGKRRC